MHLLAGRRRRGAFAGLVVSFAVLASPFWPSRVNSGHKHLGEDRKRLFKWNERVVPSLSFLQVKAKACPRRLQPTSAHSFWPRVSWGVSILFSSLYSSWKKKEVGWGWGWTKQTTLIVTPLLLLCLVAQSCPTLSDSMDCSAPGSSILGGSLGKNTRVGCHALLQDIFPTQASNPGFLHCRQILCLPEPPGKPFTPWKITNAATKINFIINYITPL